MQETPDPEETATAPDEIGRRYFELFNEIGIIAQLTRTAFESAQPDGLTLPHFTLLNHLVRLGDGRTPHDLARAFQVPKASLTNTLAGLERRGFVVARPNPKDGRGKLIHLTGAGRARREAAIGALGPFIAELAGGHGADAVPELTLELAAIRKVLDAMRD